MLTLYDYPRSSACYRVRIALHLKTIPFRSERIDLLAGEQSASAYRSLNPQARVPSLVLEDGRVLTQSLAILDYLDETYPTPALLPTAPRERDRVRELALLVACDIHPLNNSGVLAYLRDRFERNEDEIRAWYAHWITLGFQTLEQRVDASPFCFGSEPTLADIVLVPQVANARRFHVDMAQFPRLTAIDAHCQTVPAFAQARPTP